VQLDPNIKFKFKKKLISKLIKMSQKIYLHEGNLK